MKKYEKILDKKINTFGEKGLVKKIVKNDLIKQALSSDFMENVSNSLHSSWETIMKVLGVLAIVFGILQFIALLGVGGIGVLLSGVFGFPFIFSLVLGFLGSLSTIIAGWGMVKMKKWLPFMYSLTFFIFLFRLITDIMSGNTAVGNAVVGLLIGIFFWFIILKKRKTFIN